MWFWLFTFHYITFHFNNTIYKIKVFIFCFWPTLNLYFTGVLHSLCCSFIWYCRWKIFFATHPIAFFPWCILCRSIVHEHYLFNAIHFVSALYLRSFCNKRWPKCNFPFYLLSNQQQYTAKVLANTPIHVEFIFSYAL